MLADTLRQMKKDGIRRALAFVTSAYSSYSGCRQYREDIARAQEEVGAGAPEIDKLRAFFNHPGFIEATEERLRDALQQIPPSARAKCSDCLHRAQHSDIDGELLRLRPAIGRSAKAGLGSGSAITNDALVYQSRSGAPGQPWLEPDILDHLREVKARNLASAVVLAPDRIHLRPHGSALRPGHRGQAALRFAARCRWREPRPSAFIRSSLR